MRRRFEQGDPYFGALSKNGARVFGPPSRSCPSRSGAAAGRPAPARFFFFIKVKWSRPFLLIGGCLPARAGGSQVPELTAIS